MTIVQIAVLTFALLTSPGASAEDAAADAFEGQVIVMRTYTGDREVPDQTVTIPLTVLKVAAKVLPAGVIQQLEADGVSVEEIIRLAEEENLRGPIARIDDGRTGERTVIVIE